MKKRTMFSVLLVFILLICSCTEFSKIEKEQSAGKVHIVSVGLNYINKKYLGSSVSPLMVCPCDAVDFADWMKYIYEDKNIDCTTHLLINESNSEYNSLNNSKNINGRMGNAFTVTGSNIIKVINDLEVSKNDLIVFYFSGHGTCINGKPYLATLDANDSSILDPTETSLFIDALENKGCRSVVILDCCKNGATLTDSNPVSLFSSLTTKTETTKVSVIASSSIDEDSNGSIPGSNLNDRHSLFTEMLLTTLGYFKKEIPDSLSMSQLFNRTVKTGNTYWDSNSQHPEVNFNELDTVLIPKK